jgi:LPXTG-motif cell wall-anchored protein
MTPSPSTVAVTVSSDAFPQPPDVDPVTLSNTSVQVSVPAGFLQPAIDAGIFGEGQTFAASVAPVIAGSNTVEATQEFEETTTVTVRVVDGVVLPFTATVLLPDTIWHPTSEVTDVSFAEKSLRVAIVIDELDLIGSAVLTSDCAPREERVFVTLGSLCPVAQAIPCSTSTTTGPPESTVVTQATTVPGGTTLPRTGSSSGYGVFVGLSCVAGGALLLIRRRADAVG